MGTIAAPTNTNSGFQETMIIDRIARDGSARVMGPIQGAKVRVTRLRVALLFFVMALVVRPLGADLIEARLSLEGKDVTGKITAKLKFIPAKGSTAEPRPPVECDLATVCRLPEGKYFMTVVSDEVLLLRHPPVFSDPLGGASRVQRVILDVVRSARLGAAELNGYRLDVLDVESGALFQTIFSSSSAVLQVPARAIVGSLKDPNGREQGFFRVSPKPGEKVEISAPRHDQKGRGQFFCGFLFPAAKPGGYTDLAPVLVSGDKSVAPDLLITGDTWRVYAFWFDVPAGPFRILTKAREWTPRTIPDGEVPDRGALSLPEIPVVRKPSLSVSLNAEARIGDGGVEFTLLDCYRGADFAGPPQFSLCDQVGSGSVRVQEPMLFDLLTPSLYGLRWRVGRLSGFARFDMRDAQSRVEKLSPKVFEMRGRVSRRREPVSAAALEWRAAVSEDVFRATADPDGNYQVLLSQPDSFIVSIDGDTFNKFVELVAVNADGVRDFEIPGGQVSILVKDKSSGSPVAGAKVGFTMKPAVGDLSGRMGFVVADEKGFARLPPISSGTCSVSAVAPGYRRSEPLLLQIVAKEDRDESLALERSNDHKLTVLEVNGAAAAGATASWLDESITGDAGPDGVITVDRDLPEGQAVTVFTRSGAVGVLNWTLSEENRIRIPPTGTSFVVRFRDADGKGVAGQFPRYSVNGVLIPHPYDYLARVRAGGDMNSKRDGTVLIRGLPSQGMLTIWPALHPEAAITRPLPVGEELQLPAYRMTSR